MKVDIETIQNLNNPVSAVERINGNFTRLQDAIENTLSRDGTLPNHMQDVLDMNYNRIINLPAPVDPSDPVRMQDIITTAEVERIYQLILLAQAATEDAADRGEIALEDLMARYLGSYPTNEDAEDAAPGLIVEGTLYFNSTVSTFRYWDGDSWETIPYATVADGAITTQKLEDASVTWDKLHPEVRPWVSPEDFGYEAGGTDSERRQAVQSAIDYANQNGKKVILWRVYDVSGGLSLLYHPDTKIEGVAVNPTGFTFTGGIPLFRKDPQYDTGWLPGVSFKNFSITGDGSTGSIGIWLMNTLFAEISGVFTYNTDYGLVDAGEDGASKNLGSRIHSNTINAIELGIQLGGVGDEPPHSRHALIENNRIAPFTGATLGSAIRGGFAEFATIRGNRLESYTLAGVDTGESRGWIVSGNLFATNSAIADIYSGEGNAEWVVRENFYSGNADAIYIDSDPGSIRLNGWLFARTVLPNPLVLEDGQVLNVSIPQTALGMGGQSPGSIYGMASIDWNTEDNHITVSYTGNANGKIHYTIMNVAGNNIDLGGRTINFLVRGLVQ